MINQSQVQAIGLLGTEAGNEAGLKKTSVDTIRIVLVNPGHSKVLNRVTVTAKVVTHRGVSAQVDGTDMFFCPFVQCTVCLSNVEFSTESTSDNVDQVGGLARETRPNSKRFTRRAIKGQSSVNEGACLATKLATGRVSWLSVHCLPVGCMYQVIT
jgi:hypothetical protein